MSWDRLQNDFNTGASSNCPYTDGSPLPPSTILACAIAQINAINNQRKTNQLTMLKLSVGIAAGARSYGLTSDGICSSGCARPATVPGNLNGSSVSRTDSTIANNSVLIPTPVSPAIQTETCYQIPYAWDQNYSGGVSFAANYVGIVKAFKSAIGSYRVAMAKLGGINSSDVEVGIVGRPGQAASSGDPSDPCNQDIYQVGSGTTSGTAATQIWLDHGYNPPGVEQAWHDIAGGIRSTLGAQTVVSIDIPNGNNVPPIVAQGATASTPYPWVCVNDHGDSSTSCVPASGSLANTEPIAYAETLISDLFSTSGNYTQNPPFSPTLTAVENEDLYAVATDGAQVGHGTISYNPSTCSTDAPSTVQFPIWSNNSFATIIGQQTSTGMTITASGVTPGGSTIFERALTNGFHAGAQYIEVLPAQFDEYVKFAGTSNAISFLSGLQAQMLRSSSAKCAINSNDPPSTY